MFPDNILLLMTFGRELNSLTLREEVSAASSYTACLCLQLLLLSGGQHWLSRYPFPVGMRTAQPTMSWLVLGDLCLHLREYGRSTSELATVSGTLHAGVCACAHRKHIGLCGKQLGNSSAGVGVPVCFIHEGRGASSHSFPRELHLGSE